jgi:hypothetical protein
MQVPLPQPEQQPASSDTVTSSQTFVETLEHKRFIEFCDACRRFRYIGLCYGPPGIGKTLSAIRYSRNEMIVQFDRWTAESLDQLPIDTIFYTASVINTPSRIETDIDRAHERLMGIALRPLRREAAEVLDAIRLRDEARRREVLNREGCSPCERPPVDPTYFQTFEHYEARKRTVPNPATLIVVDEADRLQMNSLEQLRSIFDKGTAGLILIGMPGIENASLVFHSFNQESDSFTSFGRSIRRKCTSCLERRWVPIGVTLPDEPLLPEVIARLIGMTGGNFRLLTRLLTQIERVLEVNQLCSVSTEVVEAARDSLVIGQG